jgi:predicted transcriptional regulator
MSNIADNAHASVQKPLAVRLSEDLRAQLNIIAQLNDRSVTEEIRHAIEAWIQAAKADPKILARAESVRAEIEREAATKKGAIEAIFARPETNATSRPATDRK